VAAAAAAGVSCTVVERTRGKRYKELMSFLIDRIDFGEYRLCNTHDSAGRRLTFATFFTGRFGFVARFLNSFRL